jgi:hemolysin activation/secretion protein
MGQTRVLALAFMAACAPAAVLAQVSGAQVPGVTGTIIDQHRTDRVAPQMEPGPSLPKPSRGAAEIDASAPVGVTLKDVSVQGSSLPPALIHQAMAPLLGRPLDKATLTAAANALAELSKANDIALYTIQAPSQDLSTGVLRLRAIEGYVAQAVITPKGSKRAIPLIGRMARKTTQEVEKPLRRSTFERQVLLISDIPGVKINPTFLQGRVAGEVVLSLPTDAHDDDTTITVTSRGAPSLGRYQAQGDFSFYSRLRPGDSTTVTLSVPTNIDRFQYLSLAHSTPLGDDGLRLQGSAAYLRTRPKNAGKGDAKFGALQLSYPVIRSTKQNLYVTGSLDGLKSSNAQFGQVQASESTRVARASTAYTYQTPKQSFIATAAASAGSADFKGAAAAFPGDDSFQKLNLRLGYDQAIAKQWVVRGKGVAQISGDRLATSELFSLGGDEFGRAYTQSTLMGDQGVAGSAEIARRFLAPGSWTGSEAYVFTDSGRVKVKSRIGGPDFRGTLTSAGGGVRFAYKRDTVVGLEAAYGVHAPLGLKDKDWRFALTMRTLR